MISRNKLPKLPRPLSPQVPLRKPGKSYQPYFQKLTKFKAEMDKLEPSMVECIAKADGNAKEAIGTMYKTYQNIQNATLGDLEETVTQGINTCYSCFIGIEISSVIEETYSKFMAICVSIQHLLNLTMPAINCDIRVRHSPSLQSKLTPISPELEESKRTIICRICEHPIDIDLIEQHMQTCVAAFYSESNIDKCNHKLFEIRDNLSKSFLQIKWPGSNEKVYSIFHATMIIDSIRRISANNSDSPEEMQELIKHLQSLDVPEIQSLIDEAKTAASEKRKSVFAYCAAKDQLRQTYINKQPSVKHSTNQVTIADFEFLKRVSRGAFARVFLARKKSTGDIYAIKVQSKQDVVNKNQGKRILAEKDILLHFQNPYIVNFYYSIVGEYNFYIVMEYIPGGDLYSLLHAVSAIDEESAKFYTYQITKALEFLHNSGIIHRDLKPDNLLVDAEGNLKLTDFGLSYHGVVDRRIGSDESIVQSDSLVGTPNYVAPEIILSQKHSYPVDYWSLGAVVYELLMGEPPFAAETEKETHMRIVRGMYEHLDDEFSPECRDFVERLLTVNPEKRLGAHGAQEVLNHPWLKGYEPKEKPFIPELRSQTDTEYFKERYSFDEQADISIIKDIEAAKMSATSQNSKKYMAEFDSVGTEQLAQATLKAARHIRRQSFSDIERYGLPQSPVKRHQSLDDSAFMPRHSVASIPLPPLVSKKDTK